MDKEYVLITGATGFIGAQVTEKILSEGLYTVIAIVRKDNNYKNVERLKNKGVILIPGCFYDRQLLEEIFAKFSIRFVMHCAAVRGGGKGSQELYQTVNVSGTRVLLEVSVSHGVKKLIFCSSVGVFGTVPQKLPAGLNTCLNGDNAYHNSKIMAEKEVERFISRGLDAYIVRPTITYGADDTGFPMTLVNLVKKKRLWMPFKDIKIHLLDVESLAALFSSILVSPVRVKRVFIAADKTAVSFREMVDLIHAHFYHKPYPRFFRLPGVFFRVMLFFFRLARNEKWASRILLISSNWYYDIKDTVEALNFKPSITQETFIKRMGI